MLVPMSVKGLGKVARSFVTQRRLGDLMCDNTDLQSTSV